MVPFVISKRTDRYKTDVINYLSFKITTTRMGSTSYGVIKYSKEGVTQRINKGKVDKISFPATKKLKK